MYDEIVNAINEGQNVFITGPAGTGKSYTLDLLKQEFRMVVTASTGAAAVNVGGTTIHSFAGIGLGDKPIDEIMRDMHGKVEDRICGCDIMAIDEVSMLNAKTLDLINEVFQTVRDSDRPFGGCQMIFFGDFLQLPPVEGAFAFQGQAWEQAAPKVFHMTKVYRQEDAEFLDILHKLRFGNITDDSIKALSGTQLNGKAVNLFARNSPADNHNMKELRKLDGKMHSFTSIDDGPEHFLRQCITPKSLWVKEGARVMLTINLNFQLGLVNGTMGNVTKIEKGKVQVLFDNDVEFELGIENVCQIKQGKKVIASRHQIPLRLAWAISIHKSQGMTLEKVRANMDGIFEFGQAYVALSRATSLDGLEVKSLIKSGIKAHPEAVKFYEELV